MKNACISAIASEPDLTQSGKKYVEDMRGSVYESEIMLVHGKQ